MPVETVQFTIGGANPQVKTVQVNVDPNTGNGTTTLSYTGTNGGTDTIQATMIASTGQSFASNQAQVNWQATNGSIAVSPVTTQFWQGGQIYGDQGLITPLGAAHTGGTSLVYNQVSNGTPITGFVSPDGNSGGYQLHPTALGGQNAAGQFTSLTYFSESMNAYNGNYQGSFIVSTAGTYTFYFLVDDSWIMWINGATRVGGAFSGSAPPAPKAAGMTFMGYRLTGAAPIELADYVYVNFPAPGIYPFEIGHGEKSNINGHSYLVCTYTAGLGAAPSQAGVTYGQDISARSIPSRPPPAGATPTGVLQLTPTGGASNFKISGNTITLNLNVVGVPYVTKPYIPVLEGTSGKLYLYNDPANPTFSFPTYNAQSVDKTAAASSVFQLSGNNSAHQGRLGVTYDGTNFVLNYNGSALAPQVDSTLITIADADVAWYNSVTKSFDVFTPTASGGGDTYPIEIDYMVMPTVASVTPTSLPANGSSQQFVVTLNKPMSPQQQGAKNTGNTVHASASMTGGASVTAVTPNIDGNGWLTGWTITATVPVLTTNATAALSMTVNGTLTYLSGDHFVTGTVTYLNNVQVGTVTLVGQTFVPPVAYSFSLTPKTGAAPNYIVTAGVTITAQVYTYTNDAVGLNFIARPAGTSNQFTLGAGSLSSTSTGVVNGQTVYFSAFTLSYDSTNLDSSPGDQIGFVATDSTSGLSVTYWDSNTYSNNGGSTGGGGGCPALEMFIEEGIQVEQAGEGTLLDCLEEDLVSVNRYPIEWNSHSDEECIHFIAENGAEVIVSVSTPVLTREALEMAAQGVVPGELIPNHANQIPAGYHVLTDVGNGVEWSMLTETVNVGVRKVARLYVGGRNFAAGVNAKKRIFTHNNVAAPADNVK
jgi:hypothetical protein